MNPQEVQTIMAFAAGMLGGVAIAWALSARRMETWIAPHWARTIAFRANSLGLEGKRLSDVRFTPAGAGEPSVTLSDSGGSAMGGKTTLKGAA